MDIIRRSEWGARPATRSYTKRPPNLRRAVVHHTVTAYIASEPGRPGPKWWAQYAEGKATVAVERALKAWTEKHRDAIAKEKAAMQAMQRHSFAIGNIDFPYHFVIFPSGRVYEGRPLHAYGAHTRGANAEIGIAFAGNYESQHATPRALNAYDELLIKLKVPRYAVRGHYRVPGNATLCPGRNLKRVLNL